ncbi:hypothetical protein LEP1GSC172_0242 [Leptospira noguchii]|uniref:Uncharacterized protein n=1 Tax=Leptospira noguchii TaxID=28182 RepID=M6V5S7_9LEPT|nr:hypothetical protein LEP1GSC172_0242 [Leptospira noguchii]
MIRFKFRGILNRNELFHKKAHFVPSKFLLTSHLKNILGIN